jgi:hypothetical protein
MDLFEQNIPNFKALRQLVRGGLQKARRDIKVRPRWALLYVSVFLVVAWYVDIVSGFLWMLFLMFLIYRWDNRILGATAILLLVTCPLLLSVGLEPWAELMAVYAFFFLVMTITLQLVDLKRSNPIPGERHLTIVHEED